MAAQLSHAEMQADKAGLSLMAVPARMKWFVEAKFGLFIHWGIYAVPAGQWNGMTGYGEWIMLSCKIPSAQYEKFARQFNPVEFNAKEWVQVAKDAGMKYIVITAKHHDGFCMYDSQLTDYTIVKATPYGLDPMKELARECEKAGLKFCFYYSNVDWHHPQFPAQYAQRGFHGAANPNADLNKYVDYMHGQVRELLTNYGLIGILWFDGGGSFKGYDMPTLLRANELVDMIRQLQPHCIINNRLGIPCDYGTPEQRIPGEKPKEAFEVCMTLNRHWGYNKNDKAWKQPREVIRTLVDIASKGGNYLLNMGPTATGEFPPEGVQILQEVGKWMRLYGESIYGTSAGSLADVPWGRCTESKDRLYLHIFDWPANGTLLVSGIRNSVRAAALLTETGKKTLTFSRSGEDNVLIQVPVAAPNDIDSVVILEVESPM